MWNYYSWANTTLMEKRVDSLVFRRITDNEFDKINQPGSAYPGMGGGQGYIDFPTRRVSLQQWHEFLGERSGTGAGDRPFWEVAINSLRLESSQEVTIRHRRAQSVIVAAQKISGGGANRVQAWHPLNGFPTVYSPNIVVYIVKTKDHQFWAGFFEQELKPDTWAADDLLQIMFTEPSAGFIKFRKKVFIDTANSTWPFYFNAASVANDIPTEQDIETELELEDTSPRLQELIETNTHPEIVNRVMRIRQRNNRLVRNLKTLYGGRCQITGEQFTFQKRNGEWYSEVHHLIPLGENGSDAYPNAIVVSPLIHRMLHYANVSEINLNNIVNRQLPITINGVNYTITWHPDHIVTVERTLND